MNSYTVAIVDFYSWNENGNQNGTESEMVSGCCNSMTHSVLG